jgi:8-oxo-dGTP pyrophosphatase MutT (NUDIX family)
MKDFNQFSAKIRVAFEQGLPGRAGQDPMRPYLRINRNLDAPPPLVQPREGAVLALIYPKEELPHLALIERPTYKGVHSGQIAFPGGKIEPGESALEAALREANEEVGINSGMVDIVSPLSDVYVWASNFRVFPFVGIAHTRPDFVADNHEVANILEVPLPYFLDSRVMKERPMPSKMGLLLNAPYYDLWGKTLWGATAMMISELSHVVRRVNHPAIR